MEKAVLFEARWIDENGAFQTCAFKTKRAAVKASKSYGRNGWTVKLTWAAPLNIDVPAVEELV